MIREMGNMGEGNNVGDGMGWKVTPIQARGPKSWPVPGEIYSSMSFEKSIPISKSVYEAC